DTDADLELQYVDISNVDSSGNIGEIATFRFEDAPSRARRRVRDGDVIISTVRTYLQAIAPIRQPPANLIVSTGFAVVRPRADLFDAQYCKYALREPEFLAEVERRSVGVSYPAINASDLASIPVHIHELSRQRAIADYLDRETARIDALIAAKERLLALLAEKRRALITRAVTRGLDPQAPLRDSGIPWLGQIPA
ncbi:restriction endonuclease subunit S, partial [Pelomicrobium sp. G1]|uniref:restriction endonuclease subunit S n=1 Tax=Pelomicrobium sp. G1 TaxID=3452920 RepID=UPI003F76F78A